MTPYMCLENCMRQQLHQRYDKDMFFGITQGTRCLCGYDYELRKAIGGNCYVTSLLVNHCTFCSCPGHHRQQPV